ncbi:MAG: replicative DNA helicase [Gammaproteobacteria bacterium]|nr:replicative DNA helicase [Gammaproteobacteria bacterium]
MHHNQDFPSIDNVHNLPPIEPHSGEAEQGLLGALLVFNKAYDDISSTLRAEHFYLPIHQEIFTAISKAIGEGKTASPVFLKAQFDNDKSLEYLGGAQYLNDLAAGVISQLNVKDYAATIKELFDRRNLITGLREVLDAAYNTSILDRGTVLEMANQAVNTLVDDMPSRQYTAASAISEALAFTQGIKDGTISPIKTGLRELDGAINGLYSSCLYIIAGRPGMGKTALAMNMAENIANPEFGRPTPSAFFTLEMSAPQLAMRILARHTGIPVDRQMSTDKLSDDEWRRLTSAQQKHAKTPLIIEDCAGVNLAQIISKARKIRRTHGKFVMFIDYLGLISSEHNNIQMVHQIAAITKGLKSLAKELDIPVVLLSQLSRKVEEREDKRPLKSDLRDSGAIEQDADVIMFPYRHEYYLARQEPIKTQNTGGGKHEQKVRDWEFELGESRGKADIIIAKNRYGREPTIKLRFNGKRQLFHDISERVQ